MIKELFNRSERRKMWTGKLKPYKEGQYVVLRDKFGAFYCKRFIGNATIDTIPGFTKNDESPTSTE